MEKKLCSICFKSKPVEDFYSTKFGGRISKCSVCRAAYHKSYRDKNKEIIKQARLFNLSIKEVRATKKPVFKHMKCAVRNCSYDAIEYKDLIRYCKSHAFDKLNQNV